MLLLRVEIQSMYHLQGREIVITEMFTGDLAFKDFSGSYIEMAHCILRKIPSVWVRERE